MSVNSTKSGPPSKRSVKQLHSIPNVGKARASAIQSVTYLATSPQFKRKFESIIAKETLKIWRHYTLPEVGDPVNAIMWVVDAKLDQSSHMAFRIRHGRPIFNKLDMPEGSVELFRH